MSKFRQVTTVTDLREAAEKGARIEFTAFKDDSIDSPQSDQAESEGWIKVDLGKFDDSVIEGHFSAGLVRVLD